jgi:hypothetical protein
MRETTAREKAEIAESKEQYAAMLDRLAGQLQKCREDGDDEGVTLFTTIINELSPGEPCHICGTRSVNGKSVCECG